MAKIVAVVPISNKYWRIVLKGGLNKRGDANLLIVMFSKIALDFNLFI